MSSFGFPKQANQSKSMGEGVGSLSMWIGTKMPCTVYKYNYKQVLHGKFKTNWTIIELGVL